MSSSHWQLKDPSLLKTSIFMDTRSRNLMKDPPKPKLKITNLEKNDHKHDHDHVSVKNGPAVAFFLHDVDDIKVIKPRSVAYTSLKDLLPSSPPQQQQGITSLTNNSSWHEIPIKDPLVKHAALAYLQPMSSPPEAGEKGLCGKFKEVVTCFFCCQCGCFGWINDVIFRSVREVLWGRRREEEIDEDEEEEEEEEDDDDDDDED